ncbi:MAG: type IV pilus modification protein PilV [Gammaproteobacteria bacterium]|nr:type IV pilus modification protein PilV [Gammaproteobacteria bacterium]
MIIPAPRTMTRHRSVRGFTLLEVLIAMVVLAVGLLGLAALQTQALRFNNSAYVRSQAVQLSYDMADRMRANLPAIEAGDYNTFADYNCTAADLPADPGCIQTATGCAEAEDVAETDFFIWNQTIRATLPAGCGVVSQPTAELVEITVSWTEQVDLVGPDDDGDCVPDSPDPDGQPDQYCFVMRFEP